MVRVRVVVTIRHALDQAKYFAVALGEFAAQALCRRGQDRIVVLITLAKFVGTVAHIGHYAKSQLLGFFALAVVLADERLEAFRQSDKADAERALVDDAFDRVLGLEVVGINPEILHEQRELLCHGGFLELETLVELACCHLKHIVQLGEESVDTLFLITDAHTFDGHANDIDRGETQVTARHAGLWSETIFKHTCAAAHSGHLPAIAFGIVGTPRGVLIESGIEIEEVGEETARCNLAC